MPVYPQPMLDPNAAPWGRSVNDRLAALELAAERKRQDDINTNKQQNSSAGTLTQQVATLSSVVTSLSSVVATLQAISNVQYGEMGEATNFSGFFNGSRPTLAITSPTGRLEVGYGGSLNSGNGYFVYSVTNRSTGQVYISRDSVQSSPAQRVAVSGGASFAPSGYKNVVVNVPANTPLNVSLELYTGDSFTYFMGGSILARVAP